MARNTQLTFGLMDRSPVAVGRKLHLNQLAECEPDATGFSCRWSHATTGWIGKERSKMKRVASLLIHALFALFALGCSATDVVMVDDEAAPGEQAQAFCLTRPTGSLGDTTYPFSGYITGITPDPAADYKLLNTYTRTNGTSVVARIDFGGPSPAQARIAGSGIAGVERITSVYVGLQPYASSPNLVRVYWRGTDVNGDDVEELMTFDKRFAAPDPAFWGVGTYFGEGLTSIRGIGHQKIEFTYDNGDGTAGSTWISFTGSILSQCNVP